MADLLPVAFPRPPHKRIKFQDKARPDILVNGPLTVVNECTPRAIQYVASTFARWTAQDPIVVYDLHTANMWDANLICLGGTASNGKTAQVLGHESNRFAHMERNTADYEIVWLADGRRFTKQKGSDKGLLLKMKNPYFPEKWIIICAGLGSWGTSGAAYFLARHWRSLERKYGGMPFAIVLSVDQKSDETASIIANTPVRLSKVHAISARFYALWMRLSKTLAFNARICALWMKFRHSMDQARKQQ